VDALSFIIIAACRASQYVLVNVLIFRVFVVASGIKEDKLLYSQEVKAKSFRAAFSIALF